MLQCVMQHVLPCVLVMQHASQCVLQCVLHRSMICLHRVPYEFSVLQCIAVCVAACVAVCDAAYDAAGDAVCVAACVAVCVAAEREPPASYGNLFQCVYVRCSMCCSVFGSVWCSVCRSVRRSVRCGVCCNATASHAMRCSLHEACHERVSDLRCV